MAIEIVTKVLVTNSLLGEMVCIWIVYGESMDMVDIPSGND